MEKTIKVELTESEIEWFLYAHHNDGDPLHLKMQNAFKALNEPYIGERVAGWDDDKSNYAIGFYQNKSEHDGTYRIQNNCMSKYFKNIAKIKQEAIF